MRRVQISLQTGSPLVLKVDRIKRLGYYLCFVLQDLPSKVIPVRLLPRPLKFATLANILGPFLIQLLTRLKIIN
jgi:hypothetical protein